MLNDNNKQVFIYIDYFRQHSTRRLKHSPSWAHYII